MTGVRAETVKNWAKEIDSLGEWLRYEVDEKSGRVTHLYCAMCATHVDKLKALRNFSPSFVNGISGGALKKDGVIKHSKSDMHSKAVTLTRKPKMALHEIYKSTPIGRAMAGASAEEMTRLSKLFDLAYVIAKEEMPFTKYPTLVEVEKRHGVPLGSTYGTEHKCSEFACLIGETLKEEFLNSLKQAQYFSVLTDGSTTTSVTEKELMYILYVDSSGEVKCNFLRLKDVSDGTALGLKASLEQTFTELGIENVQERMACLCADGAAVNMGIRRGLAALLRKDMPWLIAMHCLNHRLELSAKDAFKKTYMDEISTMLTSLYYVYEKSPKRLRELRNMGDILEDAVKKTEKAHGTRWLQHKSRALKSLLISCSGICSLI